MYIGQKREMSVILEASHKQNGRRQDPKMIQMYVLDSRSPMT
jgi:hypothetical protein